MSSAAALFSALSDSSRLTILHHLMTGPHRVGELVEHLHLSQSTVSQHLVKLRESGLVVVHPEGRASVYEVASPDELRTFLTSAEAFLASRGDIVELCPTHEARETSSNGEPEG